MSFLKAEWRKLAMINYTIDSEILTPYIPKGTVLDLWNEKCYVSIVGFMFINTKILSIKVPGHINFEEVNLRFYVKRLENNVWKRGVVFIKEIVPKRALSFIANTIYNEHYETNPMTHHWKNIDDNLNVLYQWQSKNQLNSIKIESTNKLVPIEEGSEAEFISEHYWGYAKVNNKSTNEYEVTHPRWEMYPVKSYDIDINFEEVYGKNFAHLQKMKPSSVFLAEGSKIGVENKKKISF